MTTLRTNILEEHTGKEILDIIDKWHPETGATEVLGIRIIKALLNADACVKAYETDLR